MGILKRTHALLMESVSVNTRKLIFDSEGNLGIISSAVVKIFPLPEVQRRGSVLSPSFRDRVAFMYDLTHAGGQPASVRLVDNKQFQFGIALKPVSTGFAALR